MPGASPGLPAPLTALVGWSVDRCVAREPSRQLASAEELGAALREQLQCDLELARHALASWVEAAIRAGADSLTSSSTRS